MLFNAGNKLKDCVAGLFPKSREQNVACLSEQMPAPKNIRAVMIKDGGKVIFIEENGRIVMENIAMVTLKKAQNAFSGEAKRLGISTEQDVADLVKNVRVRCWRTRMRIMTDTNVLISALLFPEKKWEILFYKITSEHQLVLSSCIVDELKNAVKRKF